MQSSARHVRGPSLALIYHLINCSIIIFSSTPATRQSGLLHATTTTIRRGHHHHGFRATITSHALPPRNGGVPRNQQGANRLWTLIPTWAFAMGLLCDAGAGILRNFFEARRGGTFGRLMTDARWWQKGVVHQIELLCPIAVSFSKPPCA